MLKNAVMFAGAGLILVVMMPFVRPMLEARAPAAHVSRSQPSPVAQPEMESAPGAPAASAGYRELDIPSDGRGQYFVDAYVNGVSVRFLVDTGASVVSISSDTADRLGLVETASSPHYKFQTANGATISYGVQLKSIDMGSIVVADVPAAVNPNMGGVNLLGANFLERLASVEQRDGRLVLRQ